MDDMQSRIAARRAEIEHEREAAEAAARAERAREEADRRADAERKRADEERRRLDAAVPATREESDQLLRDTIRKRWTGAEWGVVGITAAFGLWMLSSYPIVGTLALLLAVGMYLGRNASHRDDLRKEHPELFGPPE